MLPRRVAILPICDPLENVSEISVRRLALFEAALIGSSVDQVAVSLSQSSEYGLLHYLYQVGSYDYRSDILRRND